MVKGGDRMIKQTDFDDRVDIIPISDPNIFSMSQRIMLAQQQLQLAQANPQLHNVREAYRRMYMAMGVDNVDAILKPDPNMPTPISPAMENAKAMRGEQPKAFPQQNHPEHMKAHGDLIATRMVQINPQLYAMMESHILEHIALLAAEQVEAQPEIAQQNQQIQMMLQQAEQNKQLAPQAQQAQQQFMQQKESQIATIEAKMVKEMVEEERKRADEMEDDPLVKLKQQEIDLRAMETMLKTKEEKARIEKDWTIDSERIDLDRDKLEAQVGVDLIKAQAAEADIKSKEKLATLKENMTTIRDAMKGNDNGKSRKKD
jgi:hypothetical protein